MKYFVRQIVTFLFLLVCMDTGLLANGTTITILHVNDTHSHLDAIGQKDVKLEGALGGIARAATVIRAVRSAEKNVLLLHAGDVFQGDLFFNKYFGVPEFQLMKELGFDAMAVGNHEFDRGPGFLNKILSTSFVEGSFPLLSANLDMSAFPQLRSWIRPSIIKTIGCVKVGIFGMTVPNNPTYMPAPVIVRNDILSIAQQEVAKLRNEGAQVVICLSHLGIFYDKKMAANVSGIDFVIGGHDHFLFEHPISIYNPQGKPTLILQAGEHYKYIGKLRFSVKNSQITVNDYRILTVDSSITPEPTIQTVVSALEQGIVAQYGNVYKTALATAACELTKRYDTNTPFRDTPIGNLVTDAFRHRTGTDVAITALGFISEKIYAGAVVDADVFRAMSYGFEETTGMGFKLATFTIKGSELLKGLEVGLSQLEVGDDFFIQASGMTFCYNPRNPAGHRIIVGSIRINEMDFLPAAHYTVTVNTGIAALLSRFGISVENLRTLPDFEYTVVREYIKRLRNIDYSSEGRIRDVSVVPPRQFKCEARAN